MTQLQRAFNREIEDFISKVSDPECSFPIVSKAAFSKARAKLKHSAFIELSDVIVNEFYESSPTKKNWKGYRIIACDGSKVELPNSPEVVDRFGVHSVRSDGKKITVATICEMYDPLNNICLAAKMDGYKVSESQLAWDILRERTFGAGDIFIFDRYFYSSLLVIYLKQAGADFCFRLKSDSKLVKALKAEGKTDKIFHVSIGRESKNKALEYNIANQTIPCRVTIIPLDNGTEEYLITSFVDFNQMSANDLKELYFLRWGIEEHYKKLKHRICLENFSGKSVESVFQDFYVKLFLLNLTSILVHPVDHLLAERPKKKHRHKVSFTDALSKMKYLPIKLFLEKKFKDAISSLHQWFIKNTIPIRPDRRKQRHPLPKRKYPQNYKPT